MNNIDVPETDRCAFCDYLAGRRPYTILSKSDLTAILVTREQRGIFHVLVMPTRHVPTLLEISDVEGTAIMQDLVRVSRVIDKVASPKGIAIWQNNGIPADQAIPHLHFHVAGTLPEGGTDRGEVPEISLEQTDRMAQQLAPAFFGES